MGSCVSGSNSIQEVGLNNQKSLKSTKTLTQSNDKSQHKIPVRQPILKPLINNPLYHSRLSQNRPKGNNLI